MRKGFWRFTGGFLGLVAIAVLVIFGIGYGRDWYGKRQVDKMAEALKQYEKETMERAMRDTFGGKTPQETLRMYIAAVESGDFDLGSKYFVESRREFWKKETLDLSNSEDVDRFLDPIKLAISYEGEYSPDGNSYSIHDPVLISFIKYPNGIWKIVEI